MPLQNYFLYAAGGIGASIVAGLYAFQEKLLYHPSIPTREYEATPRDFAMPYTDVEIVTEDGVKLHAWLIKQQDSRNAATFIYFHGNAGNIGHRLQDVRNFYSRGYNVLIVSYRGYGSSEGVPNEKGIVLDAEAAVSFASDRSDVLDTERIYIFGRSIGGAVAMAAAAGSNGHKIRGLVIENSFTSINDMIDVVLPALKFFKFLNRNTWDSMRRLKDVRTPILLISGLKDELCPPDHMQKLYEAAAHCKLRERHLVANGTHNDTWYYGGKAYRDAIDQFLAKVER